MNLRQTKGKILVPLGQILYGDLFQIFYHFTDMQTWMEFEALISTSICHFCIIVSGFKRLDFYTDKYAKFTCSQTMIIEREERFEITKSDN